MLTFMYEVYLYLQTQSINTNSTVQEVTDILEDIVNVTTEGNEGPSNTTLTHREVDIVAESLERIAEVLNTTTNVTDKIVEVSVNGRLSK